MNEKTKNLICLLLTNLTLTFGVEQQKISLKVTTKMS